jgi:hypothetical protein
MSAELVSIFKEAVEISIIEDLRNNEVKNVKTISSPAESTNYIF